MHNHPPFVLALEPDHRQASVLKRVLRDRVHAEVVIVDSRDAAIDATSSRIPDVILLTALLSPRDEQELIAHLRGLAGAEHVQTHTIPQLASSSQDSDGGQESGGLFGKLRRKKTAEPIPGCDPHSFADEVGTFIGRAAELRERAALTPPPVIDSPRREDTRPYEQDAAAATADAHAEEPAADAESAWSSPFEWRRPDPAGQKGSKKKDAAPRKPLVTNAPLAVVAEEEETRRAKEETERRAQEEAERDAREEAERLEAERREQAEAARRAKEEAAQRAKDEAERQAKAEADRRAKEEAERRAKEEAERRAKAEAERRAKEEAERRAKEEAGRRAKAEAERRAKEEAERRAKAEAERRAKEEAERRAKAEAERRAKEEAERRAKEEAERRAKAEAERRAKEEAERRAKEEAERRAKAEAERRAKEEAERRAREEAERRAKEEAARRERERLEAERRAKEEAERRAKEEAAKRERERLEAERREKEEAARRAREEAERRERERLEAEQRAREEADRRVKEEAERVAAAAAAEQERQQQEADERARREAEAVDVEFEIDLDRDPFADFRTEGQGEGGLLKLMPVTAWARTAESKRQPSADSARTDDVHQLISGLSIPTHVASVAYPRGCRIRRVRVPAPRPAPRSRLTRPLILSKRALADARNDQQSGA